MRKTKYMFSIYAGATPDSKKPEYWDGDIVWITPADYKTADKYVSEGSKTLTESGYNSSNTTIVPAGSIIVSKRAPIGTVSIAEVALCTNQGCLSCVPNEDIDSTFAYYALSAMNQEMQMLGAGTTFKEISANVFANMKIPYFPFPEQKAIVRYLDSKCSAIDEAIERHKKIIEKLEEFRRSAVSKVVTRGLRSSAFKQVDSQWIHEIPEHWDYVPLKSLIHVEDVRNTDPNATLLSLYTAIGVRPRAELEERGNKASTVLNYKIVDADDIIVNKLLAWMGAVAYSDYKGVTSPDYDVYRKNKGANVNRDYYHYYFRYTNFKDDCFVNGHGLMMMRWRTYADEFLRIKVPNPPEDEQIQIGEYLKKLNSKIDDSVQKRNMLISKLEEYRKSIIYNAVTGKIDCRKESL